MRMVAMLLLQIIVILSSCPIPTASIKPHQHDVDAEAHLARVARRLAPTNELQLSQPPYPERVNSTVRRALHRGVSNYMTFDTFKSSE